MIAPVKKGHRRDFAAVDFLPWSPRVADSFVSSFTMERAHAPFNRSYPLLFPAHARGSSCSGLRRARTWMNSSWLPTSHPLGTGPQMLRIGSLIALLRQDRLETRLRSQERTGLKGQGFASSISSSGSAKVLRILKYLRTSGMTIERTQAAIATRTAIISVFSFKTM